MLFRIKLSALLFFTGLLGLGLVYAQPHTQLVENRVALVIGNSDYLMGPLTNPVNDARSISRALKAANFEVILRENLSNKTEMKRAIREFGMKLKEGGVGLFYYAGHGLQVKGFNFLVPVNAVINNEEEVEYETVDAGFVVAQMESAHNRLNIMILDACRNNPFARSFRSTKQGLVSMNAPTGTLVAYATAPGSVAADGSGVNGLYTEALLQQIRKPDMKIEEVFKNVRAKVVQESGGRQTPWESSSLIGDFYFFPEHVQQINPAISVVSESKESAIQSNEEMPGYSESSARWKAEGSTYWIYVNGLNISKETSSKTEGKDLIVFQKTTGVSYLLHDFWDLRDGQFRPARILAGSSSEQATKPKDKSDTNNPLRKITMFSRPSVIKSNEKIKWRATIDNEYYILFNKSSINTVQCNYKLVGEDLYVYHPSTQRIFLLKGFKYRRDNRWRSGSLVK